MITAMLKHRALLFSLTAASLLATTDARTEESVDSPCDQSWPEGAKIADLSDETIDESSGLADSWLHSNRLWTHNDSGDQPRLWAFRKDGTVTTVLHLQGGANVDWEDIAIGPCDPESDPIEPCIYVADFGDNLSRRPHVTLYRFPEPDLGDAPPAEWTVNHFDILHYQYEGGPRDAETLLVHPITAQIWVIEKTGAEEVAIFEIPNDFNNLTTHQVSPTAYLEVSGLFSLARMVTGGDISPDGREFTYRTYVDLYTHCVPEGEPFEAAFTTPALRQGARPATIQGEALTYDRRDQALWLTSEALPAPLIRIGPRNQPDHYEPPPPPEPEPEPEPAETDLDTGDADPDFGLDETDPDGNDRAAAQSSCSATSSATAPLSLLILVGLFALLRRRRRGPLRYSP